MNNELDPKIDWCAGFFDGEGSVSILTNNTTMITIVNTNPLAVSRFYEIMQSYNIDFKITERSKPGKSSKKKRWDMYIQSEEAISKFSKLMKNRIHGKQKQLFLLEEYFLNRNGLSEEKREVYRNMMKYTNQTCYMLIKDSNMLYQKIGFTPEVVTHKSIENDHMIKTDDFNNMDYVAGILDAEGSVIMNHRFNKHRNDSDRFTPIISFTNTNQMIISKCCSTLHNNNIGYYVGFRVSDNRNRGRWDVVISGVKRVKSLSDIIKDKTVIKRQQLELIGLYCSLRIKNMMGKNDVGASYKEAIEALNK